MATTSIRWAVLDQLVTTITADARADGVTVSAWWPGDKLDTAEMIWADEIDGDVSIPVLTPDRKVRDDQFEIRFEVRVIGKASVSDTMDRLDELVAIFEDTLADDTTLGDFDGIVSAEVSAERQTCAMLPEGPVGFAEVTVAVHSRLV